MDMNISDLKKGERAVVLKVETGEETRDRLMALGVYSGARIIVLKRSLFGHGYLIQDGSSRFAIQKEIASGVRVWRI